MNTCFKKGISLWTDYSCLFIIIALLVPNFAKSQCFQNPQGQFVTVDGSPCVSTIITAVPFLRIAPDARTSGMGDAGIAISADASALHYNASKLVFAENKTGFGLTYTPWLRAANFGYLSLAYGSSYFQFNEKNAIGLGIRYFSLGEVDFTNLNGIPVGNAKPHELEFNASFAKKLSTRFSGGLGLKYIYSSLASGQVINGETITAGTSIAMDVSFTYQTPSITIGLAITNLGQKLTYTNSVNKTFIPGNIGIGIAWNKQVHENKLMLTMDINKLLVPTSDPAGIDINGDTIADYKQRSYLPSILGSFSDAPDGFSEELRELTFSFGAELQLQDFIALRAGYFHEHSTKGNRKYLTTGLGFTYKFITFNGSYLITTTKQENPLDNTFRLGLSFNFGQLNNVNNNKTSDRK